MASAISGGKDVFASLTLADALSAAHSYALVVFWIGSSALVILFNKYVLSNYGFPFPIALTMCHMTFCSIAAMLMIHVFKLTSPMPSMTPSMYAKTILPIGALYSIVLWLGNTAYLYLSVSFLQMVKAFMPVLVFIVGVAVGNETVTASNALILLLVTVGIVTASVHEVEFHTFGFLMQAGSMVCEAVRLQLIQVLLQGKKLNPIQSLFYISPACLLFLLIPFGFVEAVPLLQGTEWRMEPHILGLNCAAALMLNVSVFLLIGKTSALTMNIAGVVKDWTLICASFKLFGSPIVARQIEGYFIAFSGVMGYNYMKIKQRAATAAAAKESSAGGPVGVVNGDKAPGGHDEEKGLMSNGGSAVVDTQKR